MPVFDTPTSISVTIELGVGDLRVTATDRTDTVIEVRPSDPADESDMEAAAQVRVDFAHGELKVTGPKRLFDFSRKSRSVTVILELPSGSQVDAHFWMGKIQSSGPLGECKLKTTGDITLERTGPLRVHTGFGDIVAGAIAGAADISTASGKIRVGEIDGTAVVKNSNGDTAIDAVSGDVRVRNANGVIEVGRAGAGADLKTSNGAIRLGEVVSGSAVLHTAAGNLDIGIAEGTAAWLELTSGFGQVSNELDTTSGPGGDRTVEVRGRTSYGDITVHRSLV
ncbi:DUF4097 family beta strand repeat-containing protein [Paractinoplanes maris]|uniref:DUF4097 family beta strand repeat-containing protein n=1 Tax=Paractinoplanes maris TaxID=1734446 RepID=UPI00202009C2|nr:DUF4097 family beta strand repeat-containing protein [Actinoplanes maris]